MRQSSPYEPVFKDELGLQFHYGIRACRIQGSPTNSRTKAKKVLDVTGVYWEKPMPHIR